MRYQVARRIVYDIVDTKTHKVIDQKDNAELAAGRANALNAYHADAKRKVKRRAKPHDEIWNHHKKHTYKRVEN